MKMTEKSENLKPTSNNVSSKNESRHSRNRGNRRDVGKPLRKVVIRRLPPTMDEETFLKQIDPIPDHDEFYYVAGDWSLGKNSSSRAYINFSNTEDIFLFKDKFDGYIFVDLKGVEFPAVVEYAPFQELPRNRSRKIDTKCNSIESDTHFISFLESLKNEEENIKTESKLEYTYKIKDDKKITTTPLLEFLASKKQEKRDERRKKVEDRKRGRDDDRQKRKIQTAKSMPESIKEENREDDNTVRTNTSRSDQNQRNKRNNDRGSESKTDRDKEKEREKNKRRDRDRDRDRNKDRGSFSSRDDRKSDRDRQRRDKDRERDKEISKKVEEKSIIAEKSAQKVVEDVQPATVVSEQLPIPHKKEVKKYSERRKETRARAESRLAEIENKNTDIPDVKPETNEETKPQKRLENSPELSSTLKPEVPPFTPREVVAHIESTDTQTQKPEEIQIPKSTNSEIVEKKSENDERNNEERKRREARKIRNKDRPSIAIYQPGRNRMASKKENSKSEDDKGKEKSDSEHSSDKSQKNEEQCVQKSCESKNNCGDAPIEDEPMSVAEVQDDLVTEKVETEVTI